MCDNFTHSIADDAIINKADGSAKNGIAIIGAVGGAESQLSDSECRQAGGRAIQVSPRFVLTETQHRNNSECQLHSHMKNIG
uniref:Uncharacterized protein n=1 Tax=viral metagenome TaxID=1070528 RepID=A0A6M3K9Y9_9ZZZZ